MALFDTFGLGAAFAAALAIAFVQGPRTTNTNEQVASETATMFRAARKVVSDNQELINDATKGDKGLTGAKVIEQTKANYAAATGKPWQEAPAGSLLHDVQVAMCAAIEEVMANAQPLINESGKGFKGFLPAVFGKQIADKVSKRLDGRVHVKLTAPKALLRNRANRADEWETNVLENKFKAKDWVKGKPWSEVSTHKGRSGTRLMIPEYYGASCLTCHGDPKGEKDITGGLKEGGKLDDVGGAISVVVYGSDSDPALPGK
jgi:hypothetical protein